MFISNPLYFDTEGNSVTDRDDAAYAVHEVEDGVLYALRQRSSRGPWRVLTGGDFDVIRTRFIEMFGNADSLPTIAAVDPEPEAETEQNTAVPAMHIDKVVSLVYARVKSVTKFSIEDLQTYLWMCLERNRKSAKAHVVNTRLVDFLGQPIYLTAHVESEDKARLSESYLVETLEAAKTFEPDCTLTALPAPIQWSDNTADYVWDPTLPVKHINEYAYAHITSERNDRLPAEFSGVASAELISAVQRSLQEGAIKACRDTSYALPFYSRKYDKVNMLLPLFLPGKSDTKPVAAILLNKSPFGYSPATIITLDMAYIAVAPFRDPDNTWLKGVR